MNKKSENKKSRIGLKQVLLGNILQYQGINKWLPIAGLLTFLGLIMITNRFNGEKVIRNMVVLQDSVKNFRFESATLEAELMKLSRYSRILNECEERGLGLVPPTEPPKKIKVKR
jgi:cell division protein FtsL